MIPIKTSPLPLFQACFPFILTFFSQITMSLRWTTGVLIFGLFWYLVIGDASLWRLNHNGNPCLLVFHLGKSSQGEKINGLISGNEDKPYMMIDNLNGDKVDAIKKIGGPCTILFKPANIDDREIENTNTIMQGFKNSLLVLLLPRESDVIDTTDFTHDTIIEPAEEGRPSLLLCPNERPRRLYSQLADDIESWTCLRRLEGQNLVVNYANYYPYMSQTDIPESPDGIAMEALRILAKRKRISLSFRFGNHLVFDPKLGIWYLGCVSRIVVNS